MLWLVREFIELLLGYANEIYGELGPGYSESVYHEAFKIHLHENRLLFDSDKSIEVNYKGLPVGTMRPDIVIRRTTSKKPFFVIEFKAVVKPPGAPEVTQLKTYLNILELENGLVINFPQVGYNDYREETEVVDFVPVKL